MSYVKYGISPQLVERIKQKLKNPVTKDRVKKLVEGLGKADLQNRATIKRLMKQIAKVLNEPLTSQQEDQFADFIIAQKIDPNNTFHLLKLWGIFR
ncbi:stage VI sporulation protein F [Paenibacillus popilliae]|uniref:Serine/threonine protein kinase n=1 Tax=Paenibacillus popilliae TaxID=78057 RepID=A0ABY3ASW9_PAEPP|nr:stage VI sporulation protein F [Paenibacillus sp. SDF0028]TQR45717.1 serine/threonine protein kinase [Paenibacillus sp. SDF0028]